MGAHPVGGALSQQGINLIKPTYDQCQQTAQLTAMLLNDKPVCYKSWCRACYTQLAIPSSSVSETIIASYFAYQWRMARLKGSDDYQDGDF